MLPLLERPGYLESSQRRSIELVVFYWRGGATRFALSFDRRRYAPNIAQIQILKSMCFYFLVYIFLFEHLVCTTNNYTTRARAVNVEYIARPENRSVMSFKQSRDHCKVPVSFVICR